MQGKHAQKKLGTVGDMPPNSLSLKTRGMGGGGGSHTRTGPGRPLGAFLTATYVRRSWGNGQYNAVQYPCCERVQSHAALRYGMKVGCVSKASAKRLGKTVNRPPL